MGVLLKKLFIYIPPHLSLKILSSLAQVEPYNCLATEVTAPRVSFVPFFTAKERDINKKCLNYKNYYIFD